MSVDLSEYLIGQVLQSKQHQFGVLQKFYATADRNDWRLAVAGERVQIIKPDEDREGALEFGTELVASEDRSIVALLGASPGASTAAFIALGVLKKCFPDQLTDSAWLPKKSANPPTPIAPAIPCRVCISANNPTSPMASNTAPAAGLLKKRTTASLQL